MSGVPDLVTQVLRDVSCIERFGAADWDLLVRQGRSADLLARIDALIRDSGLSGQVLAAARPHFVSATLVADRQAHEARREVRLLAEALRPLGVDIVILKGGAYVTAGLPAAAGRTLSDIDILLPRNCIADAEALLMAAGWMSSHHAPYDQRYYREWMHELPPMQHVRRGTVVDVHHNILPLTARYRPDAAELLARAVQVPGSPGLRVLAPHDMVLHSAVHLVQNDELSHALRDLSDIDLLLRHFATGEMFWRELSQRAAELDLTQPLGTALAACREVLGSPVPAAVAPGPGPLMRALWRRAFRSPHPSTRDALSPVASFALYVRAHWMKMPAHLLVPHLAIKSWRRAFPEAPPAAA